MADYKDIAGRIRTTASDGVAVEAQEILDINKNKKQSQVNAETDATLTNHASAIQGLNSQNYVTVAATDQTTAVTDVLPATGSADTIYRVGSWDGTQYDETCYSEYSWNGSAYVHIDTKTQIGEVFDISAYHASGGTLAKYADLSAALGTNGANIPESLRKGGMSVKFVLTSDNKYVQYRLMSDEWSADTNDWAVCEETVLIENPEFSYVLTDAGKRIVLAVKKDGDIYFGAGVPQQIQDYIKQKIDELSLDEYENIVTFLDGLEEGETNLRTMLTNLSTAIGNEVTRATEVESTKVDKVTGKSLINEDIANSLYFVENPEFNDVEIDSEKRILSYLRKDNTRVFNFPVRFEGNVSFGNTVSFDGDIPEEIVDIHSLDIRKGYTLKSSDFEQGYISGGVKYDNHTKAIRSKRFIPASEFVNNLWFANKHTEGFNKAVIKFVFYDYADDAGYISESIWNSGAVTTPECIGNYFKIVISTPGLSQNITPAILDECSISFENNITVLPAYWHNHVKNKLDTILSKDIACGANGDSFVFITDTHIEVNNLISPIIIKYILKHSNIGKVVFGGDYMDAGPLINYAYIKARLWLDNYEKFNVPTYFVIGNHEVNMSWGNIQPDGYLSDNELYALFMKKNENNVSFCPDNHLAYYYDNEVQKIRYFILDAHYTSDTDKRGESMHYTEQLTWMESKISELDSDWSVLVIQHIVFSSCDIDSNGNITAAYKSTLANELVSKLDSIADNASMPTVIGVIAGHTHYDWYEYSAKGYPIIVTTTDSTQGFEFNTQQERWTDAEYIYCDRNTDEQAFDVVHIDKTNRKIYMTRIGRGQDREFTF